MEGSKLLLLAVLHGFRFACSTASICITETKFYELHFRREEEREREVGGPLKTYAYAGGKVITISSLLDTTQVTKLSRSRLLKCA